MKTANYVRETASNLHFNVTLAISVSRTKLLCTPLGSGVIYSDIRTREANEVVFWLHDRMTFFKQVQITRSLCKRFQKGPVVYSLQIYEYK